MKGLDLKKIFLISAVALSTVGCASTGVIPLGDGASYISKYNTRTAIVSPSYHTISSVNEEAAQDCSKEGKKVNKLDNINHHSGFGKAASFTLKFECVE